MRFISALNVSRPTIQTEVGAPPHQHYLPSSMQVFRPNPGSPGDPRKHPRTDLLALMECEDEIGLTAIV